MSLIEVEFRGVHTASPEDFSFVLLRWARNGRLLPIWVSDESAAAIDARTTALPPRRPQAVDVLADVLTNYTAGLAQVAITSAYEGTFIGTATLSDGAEIDLRPSDLIQLALITDLPILVDEEVLTLNSVFVADEDLIDDLGLSAPGGPEGADSAAAASPAGSEEEQGDDFEELMRGLGISESDLLGDGDDNRDDEEH